MPHICKIIEGKAKNNQPEEVQDVRWFNPEEVMNLDIAYDHKQMLIDENLI
jgi:NADH pyrophosphatase NudC (nudix superfamily)